MTVPQEARVRTHILRVAGKLRSRSFSAPRSSASAPSEARVSGAAALGMRAARSGVLLSPSAQKAEQPGSPRGLRSVSIRLCQLLMAKGKTTCGAVADDLTAEYATGGGGGEMDTQGGGKGGASGGSTPEKNIRRRIYDALNVLISSGVIEKQDSGTGASIIEWRGLPEEIHVATLESQRRELLRRLAAKQEMVAELTKKRVLFEALLARNRAPGYGDAHSQERLMMPFVAVATDPDVHYRAAKTVSERDSSVSAGTADAGGQAGSIAFEFDKPFTLHDDADLLERLLSPAQPDSFSNAKKRSADEAGVPTREVVTGIAHSATT